MHLSPLKLTELQLPNLHEHGVSISLAHTISGPKASVVKSMVDAARATLDSDLKSERDAIVSQLPEAQELSRLQELHAAAEQAAAKTVADCEAHDGSITTMTIKGEDIGPKVWAAGETLAAKVKQAKRVVADRAEAVRLAQERFEAAATAAVVAWRDRAFTDAQQAVDAELQAVVRAVEKHIARWKIASDRASIIYCLPRGQFRDPPEPEPVPAKWDYRRRLGLMPHARETLTPSIPVDAKLSEFGVEVLTRTTGGES